EREDAKKERERVRKENAKNRKKGVRTKKTTTKTPEPSTITNADSTVIASSTTKVNTTQIEKADEPEVYTPPKPEKPKEDKTAYSEGLLWLAKTYIKRENWFAAQMLIDKLEHGAVSDDIKSDLPATYAQLYIKQEKYSEALTKLNEAIDNEGNRQLRARYAFIAGQISQLSDNNTAALAYFEKAKKDATDIKMEFMAQMAIAKSGIKSGSKVKQDIIADLLKMLKEDKNKSFKDQIYFTLAEIELSLDNQKEAIEYFRNSVASNQSDQKLKSEAYYRIANMLYKKENYLEASMYYDSTFTLLQNNDPRYATVQKYVSNLKEIVTNLNNISYQDTLLYFASLTNEERKKAIPLYLERNKKEDQVAEQNTQFIDKPIGATDPLAFNNSSFFAYNKVTKTKGKEDFDKLWGRRPLEDNWRRASKALGGAIENTDTKIAESDASEMKGNKEEYEKFLREVPLNAMSVQESKDKIMSSMFVVGKLFRDKIDNFSKSAQTLENMHTRFGFTPYELDSYFYLYLDYVDLGDMTKANEYKNKIIKKYPDSKYSGILTDPNFFSKTNSDENKAEKYYQTLYATFEKGQYNEALNAIDQAPSVIGEDHIYVTKMALLRAMCIGSTEGKDAYVKALTNFISLYPYAPEQLKAKEILRFLGGDNTAFASVQDVDKIYQREENTIHYGTVVTYGLDESKHINFKVSISEFNKQYYKNERLQYGDALLDVSNNSQVILIRKFENEADAMKYYKKVVSSKAEFTSNVDYTYDFFVISQTNYRKMISERSAAAYRVFFDNNILNQYMK
ncbi:MAG: tetratricopeptide repeat protein, partial [Saprospiraceae bacterium]